MVKIRAIGANGLSSERGELILEMGSCIPSIDRLEIFVLIVQCFNLTHSELELGLRNASFKSLKILTAAYPPF